MVLRLAYTVFIGILLTLFIGVGIAAFYPQPEPPEYPLSYGKVYPEMNQGTPSAEFEKEQRLYEEKSREYQEINEKYNKNVSMLALGFAILYLIVGLVLARKLAIISDGLLLGGVLTLIYSIIRGFGANDDIFRFTVVSVSLMLSLGLGYIKFVRPSTATSKK